MLSVTPLKKDFENREKSKRSNTLALSAFEISDAISKNLHFIVEFSAKKLETIGCGLEATNPTGSHRGVR